MRVVLDTNVLVRSFGRRFTSAKRLRHAAQMPAHRLVISGELVAELLRVLRYPYFRHVYGYSDHELLAISRGIERAAEFVQLRPDYVAPIRDASDLIVLQTAELGRADLIVTSDSDFYSPETLAYCESLHIDVCTEEMALRRLL